MIHALSLFQAPGALRCEGGSPFLATVPIVSFIDFHRQLSWPQESFSSLRGSHFAKNLLQACESGFGSPWDRHGIPKRPGIGFQSYQRTSVYSGQGIHCGHPARRKLLEPDGISRAEGNDRELQAGGFCRDKFRASFRRGQYQVCGGVHDHQ